MTIGDLYPYWPSLHDEMIERLRYIDLEKWDTRPAHLNAGSIRQIVVRLARHERMWMEEVIQGRKPTQIDGSTRVSPEDLISELESARAITDHWLKTRSIESLREVREAPADPLTNEPEHNAPISWILWRLLEAELIAWGQIKMRLED